MSSLPDFTIGHTGRISNAFTNKGIRTFHDAITFIQALPYKRNSNKDDLATVISDACGTCGTKHAILKALADENGLQGIDLIMGIYRMHDTNTRGVGNTLQHHGLNYIPEAHNYLVYNGERYDFTSSHSNPSNIFAELLEETIIAPDQITAFKVNHHKNFLRQWLADHPEHTYTLDELWAIREQCIADLAAYRATKS